jgi:nitrite reductase (NO-forming)
MEAPQNNYTDHRNSKDKIEHFKNIKKLKFTFSIILSLILVTYVFIATDTVFFNRGTIAAMGQVSNQSNTQNNKTNSTSKSPNLVMSNITGNITKMTTTQGNQSTNANAASPFPPNQGNATNTFPTTNKVAIVMGAALLRDKAYQPNPVNVKVAGTITWTNEDTVVHTVTSGSGFTDPNLGRDFDSGLLGKGFSHIFFKPGEYPYFCQIHPTMVGKVIVK